MAIMSFTSWNVFKRFALMRPKHAKIYSAETKCSVKNIIIYGCLSRSSILHNSLKLLHRWQQRQQRRNKWFAVSRMSSESKTRNVFNVCQQQINHNLKTFSEFINGWVDSKQTPTQRCAWNRNGEVAKWPNFWFHLRVIFKLILYFGLQCIILGRSH